MAEQLEISKQILRGFWWRVGMCSHGKSCEKCCWPWLGNRKKGSGYGRFYIAELHKKVRAHRIMWIVAKNCGYPIPEGYIICHTCDVTFCVNFHHLYVGTQADNVADKVERGRARGNTTPRKSIAT